MSLAEASNLVLAGLASGAIYAMLAVGYNVIFATTGILNFAHGELFMLGAMLAAFFIVSWDWPVLLGLPVTMALAAVLGGAVERVAVRPATAKGRGAMGWVLSTLGVAIAIRAVVALLAGPDVRLVPPIVTDEPTFVGDVRIVPAQLWLVALALLITVGLDQLYRRTLLGKALSAVAQDSEASAMRGIAIGRLSTMSFAVGSAIAALTGYVSSPLTGAFPALGFVFALKGFIAAAVGGIPDIRGALVGGLILGVVEAFGVDLMGAGYRDLTVFAVLLAVLAVRPAGLFGRESVRAV